MFQRILGLTASGLGGFFVLGIFTRRANLTGALTGAVVSAIFLYWLQAHTKVVVYLYAMAGMLACIIVGYVVSIVFRSPRPLPPGLTVYDPPTAAAK